MLAQHLQPSAIFVVAARELVHHHLRIAACVVGRLDLSIALLLERVPAAAVPRHQDLVDCVGMRHPARGRAGVLDAAQFRFDVGPLRQEMLFLAPYDLLARGALSDEALQALLAREGPAVVGARARLWPGHASGNSALAGIVDAIAQCQVLFLGSEVANFGVEVGHLGVLLLLVFLQALHVHVPDPARSVFVRVRVLDCGFGLVPRSLVAQPVDACLHVGLHLVCGLVRLDLALQLLQTTAPLRLGLPHGPRAADRAIRRHRRASAARPGLA